MSKKVELALINVEGLALTERQAMVLTALKACNGNKTKAGESIGISRATVGGALKQIEKKNGIVIEMPDPRLQPKVTYDQFTMVRKMRNLDGLGFREISRDLGMSTHTIKKILEDGGFPEYEAQAEEDGIGGTRLDPIDREVEYTGGKKVFFITSAQNNTHIFSDALKSIKQFQKHRDAEIKVVTYTYAQTAAQKSQKGDGWYDKEIVPYIEDNVLRIADDLVLHGNLNILPTAMDPLSSLEGFCRQRSGIFAHAKQEMDGIPQPKGDEPGLMYTTGTLTHMHYRQQKAGQKAEFNHIIGGLVVEINENGTWFVRQVNMESETGNFYDWDTYYTPTGWTTGHAIAGLTPGDIHTQQIHPIIAQATLGVDVQFLGNGKMSFRKSDMPSLITELRPEFVMAHDICDFKARNHHENKNFHTRHRQFIEKDESILQEIDNVGALLCAMEEHESVTPVVVNSNHDRATMRYLIDNVSNWHQDHVNAEFFLETQLAMVRSIKHNVDFDPLEWNIRNKLPHLNSIFLKLDESFVFAGVENGFHGDIAGNGAKGGIKAFVKMGIKMNIGHGHTAKIKSGVFQGGITCDKNPAYARGPSSWSWSHTLTYPNGKRTIVTMRLTAANEAVYRGYMEHLDAA